MIGLKSSVATHFLLRRAGQVHPKAQRFVDSCQDDLPVVVRILEHYAIEEREVWRQDERRERARYSESLQVTLLAMLAAYLHQTGRPLEPGISEPVADVLLFLSGQVDQVYLLGELAKPHFAGREMERLRVGRLQLGDFERIALEKLGQCRRHDPSYQGRALQGLRLILYRFAECLSQEGPMGSGGATGSSGEHRFWSCLETLVNGDDQQPAIRPAPSLDLSGALVTITLPDLCNDGKPRMLYFLRIKKDDLVEVDQPLCYVYDDAARMLPVVSRCRGVVTRVFVENGENLPVGGALAQLRLLAEAAPLV